MTQENVELTLTETIKAHAIILGGIMAVMWGLELFDQILFSEALDQWGIRPRSIRGLWGIFFAPFLHKGWPHLTSNSVPFIVMGWFLLFRGITQFFVAFGLITVMAGLGVWLIGAGNSVHIGASGVVFGFLGFLLMAGIVERSLKAIISAIIVGVAYGGIIMGVLPTQGGISWEGHLFGLLGGIASAKWIVKPASQSDSAG